MKRFLALIICAAICLGMSFPVFAAESFSIGADAAKLIKDDIVLIPVEIKDNKGIMGFRITVEYPTDKLNVMSVSKGSIVKNGNFNTSYSSSTSGSFDVLWNNTEDISDNGTLFIIGVKALKYFDKASIILKYSQEDTFNEKWEDVIFNCSEINVSCLKNEQAFTEKTTESALKEISSANDVQISEEQFFDAVRLTLKQLKYDSISEIKEKDSEKFVSTFNSNLKTISGADATYGKLRDIELLYNSAFENRFIQKANETTDSGLLKAVIESSLNDVNAEDIKSLDKNKEKKFIKTVQEKLQELNPDVPSLSDSVDQETAMKSVKKLYGGLTLAESDKEYITSEENGRHNTVALALGIALTVLVVAFVLIMIIKAKKRKEQIEK